MKCYIPSKSFKLSKDMENRCSQFKWPIAQAPWILRQGLTCLLLAGQIWARLYTVMPGTIKSIISDHNFCILSDLYWGDVANQKRPKTKRVIQ